MKWKITPRYKEEWVEIDCSAIGYKGPLYYDRIYEEDPNKLIKFSDVNGNWGNAWVYNKSIWDFASALINVIGQIKDDPFYTVPKLPNFVKQIK